MNSAHGWAGSETFTGQNWLIISPDATIGSLKAADLFALDISGSGSFGIIHHRVYVRTIHREPLIIYAGYLLILCWLLASSVIAY